MQIKIKRWELDEVEKYKLWVKVKAQKEQIFRGESFERSYEVFVCRRGLEDIHYIFPTSMPHDAKYQIKLLLLNKLAGEDERLLTLTCFPPSFIDDKYDRQPVMVTGYVVRGRNWYETGEFAPKVLIPKSTPLF